MTDLERLRDDDGALGAAFRSAEYDAPKAGATAALLTALSLGAVGAVGAASAASTATAAATAASTTATSVGAASSGAAGAAIKTSTFAAAWKLFAVSAVVVSGAVASVHVATRDLAAPSTTPSGTVHMASSAKPAIAPRGYVAPQPIGALEAIPEPSATALADQVVASPTAAIPSPLAVRAQEPAPPHEESNGMGHTATPDLRVSAPSAVARAAEAPVPNASAASIVPAASAALSKDEPSRALPNTPSGARVADEVSALDGARSLLSSGRPAEALSALTAYEKAFPRPVLGEEALALKVEALVRAGRLPEAASLGNAFLERSPSSPVASRVRRSLGAAKK